MPMFIITTTELAKRTVVYEVSARSRDHAFSRFIEDGAGRQLTAQQEGTEWYHVDSVVEN